MKKKKMCKIILTSMLFLLFRVFMFPDLVFDNPSLIIGIDESKEKDKNYVLYDFFMVRNALIGPDDLLYTLDIKDNSVCYFDLKGKFLGKYGRTGQGPGELNSPIDMNFVGKKLWIANTRNSRIEIFDKTGKNSSIRIDGISMPLSVASTGSVVGVSGGLISNIVFLDNKNKVIYRPKIQLKGKYNKYMAFWKGGILEELNENLFIAIYRYLPLVSVINPLKKKYITYDLSDFYSPYGVQKHNPKKPPEGYAVITGCKGPNDSVFLIICQQTGRCCNRLLQFSSDFKKKISEVKLSFCVREMRYYHEQKTMLFVTGEDEVRLYSTE